MASKCRASLSGPAVTGASPAVSARSATIWQASGSSPATKQVARWPWRSNLSGVMTSAKMELKAFTTRERGKRRATLLAAEFSCPRSSGDQSPATGLVASTTILPASASAKGGSASATAA
jgi:hypothetical protein